MCTKRIVGHRPGHHSTGKYRKIWEYPYVYLDGIWLKRCWAGEVRNVSVLVAVGMDQDGYRVILGAHGGAKKIQGVGVSF